MKQHWPLLSGLLLLLLLSSACAPVETVLPTPQASLGVTYAPSVMPPDGPTLSPLEQTQSAADSARSATQWAGEQATIIARATAAPFPTGEHVALQAGQPSSATARRGGLTLEARLPKDTYLAGEAGVVELMMHNDGPETVFVDGDLKAFSTALVDAQGHEASPWPWWPLGFPRPAYMRALAPGETISDTAVFHVPASAAGAGTGYAFWVETRFSRPSPANAEGPDNVWLRLEAGPLLLQVLEPKADQGLQAKLDVDGTGWKLSVVDSTGQVPAGPLRGTFEAATFNSLFGQPLTDTVAGGWSGTWEQAGLRDAQIIARAWLGAPGYVTAVVTQTVPGPGDAATMLANSRGPEAQSFNTLEAAQAALGLPLFRLGDRPAGALLHSVQTESNTNGDARWASAHQVYQQPGGTWLELTQLYTNQQYASAGWGQAHDDREAQAVSVGGQPGYLIHRFGWWVLDWKVGADGFELRAPLEAMSQGDLIAAAESVRP